MKSWEPEEEFERADFPRTKKQNKQESAAANPALAGKQVKAWTPRSVSEASAAPVQNRPKPADAKPAAPSPSSGPASAPASTPASPRVIQGRTGFAAATVGESMLENLEAAGRELRRLYWLKPGPGLSGKRQIKAVIQKAGPQALAALKSVMTQLERSQIAEIVKTEADCEPATIEQICREFVSRLRR